MSEKVEEGFLKQSRQSEGCVYSGELPCSQGEVQAKLWASQLPVCVQVCGQQS